MEKVINCVAFDLGASGGKVILGEFNGSKLRLTDIYRFPNNPIQLADHVYWDFLHLFEEVKKGLQLANKVTDGRIDSIGLDTWGDDFALLDKQGRLMENPFSYRDPQTVGMMEKAFEKMPREELYRRTGVQFMQMNTLFQLLSIVQNDPHRLYQAETFLMMPDLFNYYLSGVKSCEFTNVTTTQFYDPRTNDWNWPILETMEIPCSLFPPIIQPGTILGGLSAWLCGELGVPSIPVVAVVTHDTPSAVSVVPFQDRSSAFISSGTWSLLGSEEPAPVINQAGLEHNFSSYGGAGGTWLIWKNIQALWLLQECMRAWSEAGKIFSHEEIILMANQARQFGPIVDTDDLAFMLPGDFPSKIIHFCQRTGQQPPENEGAMARCILESLALKYRYTFERLQEVVGRKLDRLYVIGGGSRNWLLNQFTAEAVGLPVLASLGDASSVGNINMQLIALKELDGLEESRQVIRDSFETASFESCKTYAWDEAYEKYLHIITMSKTFNL